MDIREFIAQDQQENVMSIYRVVNDNVIVSVMQKGVDLNSELINESFRKVLADMGTDHCYSIYDLASSNWYSKDARNWIYSDCASEVLSGCAIIAGSMVYSLLADTWASLVKLPFPFRRFSRLEDALEWIEMLKENKRREQAG